MDEYTYSSAGNLLALTENKNGGTERITTFTWNASGQMTGIDGPRTDAADTLAFIYLIITDFGERDREQLKSLWKESGYISKY